MFQNFNRIVGIQLVNDIDNLSFVQSFDNLFLNNLVQFRKNFRINMIAQNFDQPPPMVKSFNQTGQIILVQPFDNLADMDFVVFVQSDNDGINHLLTDTVLNLLTLLFAGKFSLFFNFGAG